LGLKLELIFASRIGADATLGLASVFAPLFAPLFASVLASTFSPVFTADVAVVADDRLGAGSGVELDIDVASVPLKPEGADDGCLATMEAICVAVEIGIAFTPIEVPQVRLHSTRQCREIWLGPTRDSAIV